MGAIYALQLKVSESCSIYIYFFCLPKNLSKLINIRALSLSPSDRVQLRVASIITATLGLP